MQQRSRCAVLVFLAFLASAVTQELLEEAASGEAAALESDAECLTHDGAAGSDCALSALQLRAKQQQQQEQEDEKHDEQQGKEQDEEQDEELDAEEAEHAKLAEQSVEAEPEDWDMMQPEPPAEAEPPQNESLMEVEHLSTSAHCFSYTGGTCVSGPCAPYRHAKCHSGKCVCQHGCAGADGKCYSHHNRLLAKGVLLRNAKYRHYKMYFQRVSTFGQMKTTRASSWMNMDQDKFDIFQIPGSDFGHKEYFLASRKWKNYVVGMKNTGGTALSPFAAYSVNLNRKGGVLDLWGTSNIMLRICETSSGNVQIGAKMADAKTIWAYVHHGSWYVYGSVSSPGWGGEWKMEPAPPHGTFPPCHGHHSHR